LRHGIRRYYGFSPGDVVATTMKTAPRYIAHIESLYSIDSDYGVHKLTGRTKARVSLYPQT